VHRTAPACVTRASQALPRSCTASFRCRFVAQGCGAAPNSAPTVTAVSTSSYLGYPCDGRLCSSGQGFLTVEDPSHDLNRWQLLASAWGTRGDHAHGTAERKARSPRCGHAVSLASKSSVAVVLLKFCEFRGISLTPCWQTRTEAKAHLPAASRLASAARPTVHRFARKHKQKLGATRVPPC
jgi:hypothetical protein